MKSTENIHWDAWLKTEGARKCLDGNATGIYLKNRLWHAFMAGFEAGKHTFPEPVDDERPINPGE